VGEVDDGQGQGTEDHSQRSGPHFGCYEYPEMLGYITRNPCRGVQLPGIEKAEDKAMFLTHSEFSLIMEGMGERYKAFTSRTTPTGREQNPGRSGKGPAAETSSW
jgi:hypothetical protein